MTDANVLSEFLMREQRWLGALHELRQYHEAQMGKLTTGIRWIGGKELGRFSWLGYYWHREMFWFGYGLHEGVWRPLIEADSRSEFSGIFENMQAELVGTWESVPAERNLFRRLWAEAGLAGTTQKELEWLRARSRELHEFVIQPGP